jgi:hypothetical protein
LLTARLQSRSSKDLAKALNGFLQAPTLPLPAEINSIIASYLEKHGKPDEGSGERLGEELLAIWEKVVQDHPARYAAFLAILRRLRPGLGTPARVFKWWDKLLDPVLDHVGQEKGLAREVMGHTLDLLSADEYDERAAWSEGGLTPLINRLLTRWTELRETQPDFRPSADLKEQMIQDALMAFGKKDPKGFMNALNGFLVKKEHRNSALTLLCGFVSSGPPHLHVILQTPLFVNILHSLQKDESTTTVNLALITLIMILPFVASSLVPFLPTLFNIYTRVLFWDRESYFTKQHTEMGVDNGDGLHWDKSLLDPSYDGHSLSYMPHYFTMLYGLYPINFVEYIRKPQRYLRHANNDEDIDVQAMEIRDRSEPFRKQHLLHPNFYNFTIESEKTDMSRWIKTEGDEVLADCLALVIQNAPGHSRARPATPLPGSSGSQMGDGPDPEGLEAALLGSSIHADLSRQALSVGSISVSGAHSPSIRRGSQSSHPTGKDEFKGQEPADDGPILPPDQSQPQSGDDARNAIPANIAANPEIHQSLTNDSAPSLLLNPQEQASEKSPRHAVLVEEPGHEVGPSITSGEPGDLLDVLQHHRLRLINDLQYERFIKQQHMVHMGELRRRQIRVSATEAETQNLIMANRSLKQRLDEANRREAQIRKEFDNRRNMAKKWESDLSNKLRVLREEQRKWNAEGNELRQQLGKVQVECESLRRIVSEAEKKRLESEQNLEAVDISTAMIEKLKTEIARLSASEREFQGKEAKLEIAVQEAAAAQARAQEMVLEVAAREKQLQESERHYQSRIEDLKAQLAKALQDQPRKKAIDVAAAYESSLSSLRTKNTELEKQQSALLKKYTALQSTLLDLQCDIERRKGRSVPNLSADGDSESLRMAKGAAASRNRQAGFSAADLAKSLVQSPEPPTAEPTSTSHASTSHPPLRPSSQHNERSFSRGE